MSIILPDSLVRRYGVHYKTGDIIFCEFEKSRHFYFLQVGSVHIMKLAGQQRLLDVIESGNFFGEMAMFENMPRSATAIAKESVLALRFNSKNFLSLIQSNPEIPYKLMVILCQRLLDAKRRLRSLTFENPELRVVDTILRLVEKAYSNDIDREISINMNYIDIAQWCGIPATEVKNILEHIANNHLISLSSRKIYVRDIKKLKSYLEEKIKTNLPATNTH